MGTPSYDPSFCIIFIVVLFVFILLILGATIRVVAEHQRLVVFRLGRFLGVYGPGISLLFPFVDKAVVVDLRERVRKIEKEAMMTSDRHRVTVDVVWSYKIIDPAKSVLEVENLESSIYDQAVATLRAVIEQMTYANLRENPKQVAADLRLSLQEMVERWGVEIVDAEVRSV